MTSTPSQEERREAIVVTQADRSAAADIYQRFRDHDMARWCKAGKVDADGIVQAFARHRFITLDPPTFPVSEEARGNALLNLLAVIHRDGGHKTEEIGWKLSAQQAELISSERIAEINELRSELAAFRGSGVAPQASGAPLCGQALGPADPEPVPVSALPGDDPSRVTLVGHLEWQGSKRGERYFNIECPLPYVHTAFVTIYGDEGREGDDDLTNDLFPHLDCKVSIECNVDTDGYLISRPSWIAPASAMSGRSPETEGLSPKGASATAEGGDAQNTPDPTPLSGKD